LLLHDCGHAFCKACISEFPVNGGCKKCPSCRTVISKSVGELRPNFALLNVVEWFGAGVHAVFDNFRLSDVQHLIIAPSRLTISTVMSRVGASGSVWTGYLDGDKEVAIKMIALPQSGDGVEGPALSTLKKEMAVIVKASHKCHFVCRYYGVSVKDNHFCLVMTKYAGSLAEHIAKQPGGKLGLPAALRITHDIVKGLSELHSEGIAVLDVKPDNILMTSNGTAVITDFGISKVVSSTIGMVTQSGMAGTCNYMSPEQMEDGGTVGIAADWWALACTIIHMLTGAAPMSNMNIMQIMTKIHVRKGAPELPGGLPPRIHALLTSCLSHNPSQRPTANQIQREIEEATTVNPSPLPDVPHPPSAPMTTKDMLMAAIKGDVATLALALSQRSPRLDVDARVPRDSGVQEFEWNDESTALILASREGHKDCVTLLLNKGADPSCHNSACRLGLCTSIADHLTYLQHPMYRTQGSQTEE